MKRYLTNAQVSEIADLLEGTCMSTIERELRNLGLNEAQMTDLDWDAIYDQVYECDFCGWWNSTVDSYEINGDIICERCHEDV